MILFSQDSSPAEMGDRPPAWMNEFIRLQADSMSAVMERSLSAFLRPSQPEYPSGPSQEPRAEPSHPEAPPKKKTKKTNKPPSSPVSHPQSDSEEEFEKRYGHLISKGDDDDVSRDGRRHEEDDSEDEDTRREDHQEDTRRKDHQEDTRREDRREDTRREDHQDEERPPKDNCTGSDSDASVDNDLVKVLQKVPNFDTSSSISYFIRDSADNPMPDEFLKQLNDEHVPNEKLQKYFLPPSMPTRLYKSIARMKSKGALKTEKAMFAAQTELFIIAKPLLAAIIKLRPLGEQVGEARGELSISLHGIFSVSLKISRARRENVRFLFKEALADILYSYPPRYCSLFGGDSFNSQVEKASKESKIDLSWSKSRPTVPYQPFRNQGFRTGGNTGYTGYYNRQTQRGRRGNYRGRGGYNNNKKSGFQKSKRGSGGGKSQ